MLIGIDGNEANEVREDIGAPAGVNVYAFELLRSIRLLQDEWKDRFSIVVYLKHPPSRFLPKEGSHFKYKVLSGGGQWILTKLMPHLFFTSKRPSILFSPSHYTPPFTPMPRVASIMDLGYLKFSTHLKKKDFWQLKYWTANTIRGCKRLLAISESTKEDIVRHYKGVSSKVVVTPLAYDSVRFAKGSSGASIKAVKVIKERYSIGSDYVLYLGVIKPSKNVGSLVEAWAKIVDDFPRFTLVIAGKKGWMYSEIFDKVKRLGLTKKIIFTDYINEKDKPALIAGAKLFTLPSFWEGFGLDVLNAMALGIPVALSKVGSLPEVAGDAGTYFDPNNINDIAEKIKKVLSLPEKDYNKLVEKSLNQVKKFSWKKTARKTLEVLESAI